MYRILYHVAWSARIVRTQLSVGLHGDYDGHLPSIQRSVDVGNRYPARHHFDVEA